MLKSLFSILFIFFLPGLERGYSQAPDDSTSRSEIADSVQTVYADSTIPAGENADTQYLPVADSNYIFKDTIRKVSGNQLKSYLLNPDYEYANDSSYWRREAPVKPGPFSRVFNSNLLAWIIRLGVIGLVIFGIFQLARENSFSWLSRRAKSIVTESPDDIPESDMDYDIAIKKYQAEDNYRMAVRYMYLRLVRTLQGVNGIQVRDSSTNTEIVRALGSHPRSDEFRYLAMAYEYIYYGGFTPGQDLYVMIKNKFESFQQSITP
jgi:hypothetical protein